MSMKRCRKCGKRYVIKWHNHRVSSTCPYCGHLQEDGTRTVQALPLPDVWVTYPSFYTPQRYVIEKGKDEGTVRIFFSSRCEEFSLEDLRRICEESEEILKQV